jgi:hypothetical protein
VCNARDFNVAAEECSLYSLGGYPACCTYCHRPSSFCAPSSSNLPSHFWAPTGACITTHMTLLTGMRRQPGEQTCRESEFHCGGPHRFLPHLCVSRLADGNGPRGANCAATRKRDCDDSGGVYPGSYWWPNSAWLGQWGWNDRAKSLWCYWN